MIVPLQPNNGNINGEGGNMEIDNCNNDNNREGVMEVDELD